MELGTPIALGRTAEIYAWQPGTILKLFFNWFGLENIEYEARIARAIHASGLRVPAVQELVRVNERNGLVYERAQGQAMWEVLARAPRSGPRYARRMAELHAQMHASAPLMELPAQRERLLNKIQLASSLSAELRAKILTTLEKLPDGEQVCHGDFHPGNILVAPRSETIIDWIDATRGNPLADLARTSIIALGAAETSQTANAEQKAFVRTFHAAYLRNYFKLRPGGQAEYQRWLPVIAAARLSENIRELEKWLLAQAAQAAG